MALLDRLDTEADLEDALSAPSEEDIACCRRLGGDVLVLGAGGKMGPSLVRRIVRAFAGAGAGRRVFAASRFSDPSSRRAIESCGATVLPMDLLEPASVNALPDCPHVLFLAGRKFGSTDNTALTWVTNTVVPGSVARRFAGSRIVAFSTGNVYPFVPVSSRGSVETDVPSPRGDYAQSCLGRERVFEYYARQQETPTLIFRLNYAVDLRYGVLVDIARAVKMGEAVDRTVSHFNVIWQGDANSYALRSLEGCRVPVRVLNVTGADTVSVTDAATFFGERFGVTPAFSGRPGGDALLSDASACHQWLGPPRVGTGELMQAVAVWLERGGRMLEKPTHFEVADGKVLMLIHDVRERLLDGLVIPAHPLALDARRRFDERHQAALTRYYRAAGAGGIAVGVHTTQFAIRDPRIQLFEPVLALAADVAREDSGRPGPLVLIAGICGRTEQATKEAELAVRLGYDAGLVSLAALRGLSRDELIAHCRTIASIIPVFGFYLQPAVGGLLLDYDFWRAFLDIEPIVAIKVAPFNRYHTLDVVRALADSGRQDEVALYTGNDDNILADLLAEYVSGFEGTVTVRFSGGLGQWAVWTERAVALLADIKSCRARHGEDAYRLLAQAASVTDANAALFDAPHAFAGCIAGLHEILRRQGLLAGIWCLDPNEGLSPGQLMEIERVCQAYPHLQDDEFVAAHLSDWLKG